MTVEELILEGMCILLEDENWIEYETDEDWWTLFLWLKRN